MKERIVLLSCLALLVFGSASRAEGERPYIGVRLDPAPLPELLTKHLGLEPGQGLRISNINLGSPADKMGLERDDIIIAFQGQKVTGLEPFVEAVGKAGVGTEVALEVIHLGQRKSLQIKLEPIQGEENVKWKYPPEPEVVTSWRPGKFFKVGPDGRDWMEIPFDKGPPFDLKGDKFFNKFFQEVYTYHHTTDGEDYTITIEGNPENQESKITVRAGESEYSTTRDNMDALPEKYRGPAQEALDNARKSLKKDILVGGKFRLPQPPSPEAFRKYFDALPRPDMERWSEQKDQALQMLQEQMERLQQRMQEMEKSQREMVDKLLREIKKDKSEESEKPASAKPGDKQAI